MTKNRSLSEALQDFMSRDDRNAAQLSRRTRELFGQTHQVQRRTITRWHNELARKPHHWQDLVRVAIALELSNTETDELLTAAQHPKISELRRQYKSSTDQELLAHWRDSPFQVPADVSPFVGHESNLRRLNTVFRHEAQNKVCCFIGMGGVGKTALAIRAAYHFRERFPDGVLWARLDKAVPMAVLHNFADAYGIDVSTHYPDLSTRSAKVREILATKQALIILDNAENDEQVQPLLPPHGHCAVIITTQHHNLTVADTAERFLLNPFVSTDQTSLTLFARFLKDEDWVRRDGDIFKEIAGYVGHLPLAIRIAAFRLKHEKPDWSAADFLKALQESGDKLKPLTRGTDRVETTFDLSYNKLTRSQQRFFTALSLFASSDFSVESTAAINELPVSVAKDMLRHLYNLSLLQLSQKERFGLHPLLRVYGYNKLGEDSFREQFIRYFTDYVVEHQETYRMLDQELENILYTFELATNRKMYALLVQGVIVFYPYLKSRGLYEQALDCLGWAQEAAKTLHDRLNLAKLMGYQAEILRRRGRASEAFTLYQEALTLVQEQSDTEGLKVSSWLLTGLGGMAFRNGRLQEAKTTYNQALTQARRADDEARQIMLTTNLGLIAATIGDVAAAESLYKEALNHARQSDIPTSQITALQNLGVLYNEQGEQKKAKDCFESGLTLAQELKSPEFQSRLLGNLGVVANAQGNHREAKRKFQQALTLAEKLGHQQLMSRHMAKLALVESHMRNDRQANVNFKDALTIADREGWPGDISGILVAWGEFHLKQLAHSEAAKCFERAYQLSKECRLKKPLGKSLYGLAQIAKYKGDIVKARQLGKESKEILDVIGHKRASDVRYWLKELSGNGENS